ncbi:MAG: pyridoxamine 5'-phosphate oxidase family protein [Omnitrophica WOR_2 bacterium]
MKAIRIAINAITDPAGTPVSQETLSIQEVQASLFQMLEENVLCSIATVTSTHQAYVNTAYFSYTDDLKLYFLSHPGSQHCQNLMSNPSMAMAVFSSSQTWGGPDRGLQLFGTCDPALGSNATRAANSYKKRFPAYADWQKGLGQGDPGKSYRLYRFLVNRVKIFDERGWGESLFVLATISR